MLFHKHQHIRTATASTLLKTMKNKFFNLNRVEHRATTEYKNYKHLSHLRDRDIDITPINPGSKSGGQNINRNKTAVDMRINMTNLSPEIQDRRDELSALVKINEEGDIIIKAKEHKSKLQNEKAAFKRLNNAIEKVLNPNPNQPSEEERERRREKIKRKQAYAKNKSKENKKQQQIKKKERRQKRVYR